MIVPVAAKSIVALMVIVTEAPLAVPESLKFDTVLCCEQISLLVGDYAKLVRNLADGHGDILFAFTLGPSHHSFTTFHLSDFRSGVVNPGEIMTELSHPIQQRVQQEVLRIVQERHGYTGGDVWPPKAKQFGLAAIRFANERAWLRQLFVAEEVFLVPGHQIINYSQNGWTSFFRHAPLADLPTEVKIAILILVLWSGVCPVRSGIRCFAGLRVIHFSFLRHDY